ncbi:HNH endonuclease signature motif containing protein [Tersicoccus solisilvae]|nr:HNH endonuclease signature motif containing protein [Tersicoccus solisilvae]
MDDDEQRSPEEPLPGLTLFSLVAGRPGDFGMGAIDRGLTGLTDFPVRPDDVVSRLLPMLAGDGVSVSMEAAVAALRDASRLSSWLSSATDRLALMTVEVSAREHERWVDAHPLMAPDDRNAPDGTGSGLSRRARLAVAERSGVAEIAGALRTSENAVHGLLNRAERLRDHLPRTAAALASGAITSRSAEVIADDVGEYVDKLGPCTSEEDADRWRAVIEETERCLLPAAVRGATRGGLQARSRRIRERCHPIGFERRREVAEEERWVCVSQDRDGMARLSARLPAAVAHAIDGRLCSVARQMLAEGDGTADGRTMTQLRADVLVDLLGGLASGVGAGGTRAEGADIDAADSTPRHGGALPAPPRVLLTVSAATLQGSDEPGLLGDFGPIAAADARYLASLATSFSLGVVAEGRGLPSGTCDHATDGDAFGTHLVSTTRTARADECGGDGDGGGDGGTDPPTHPPGVDAGRGIKRRPVGTHPPGDADPPGEAHPPGEAYLPAEVAEGGWPDPAVIPVLLTSGRQYRLPARLRNALALRDGTCRFPGCRRSAVRCDADHVVAWADGGTTGSENLAHLCRTHHVLKHHSAWTVEVEAFDVPGSHRLAWTSPAGARYVTDPEPAPVWAHPRP